MKSPTASNWTSPKSNSRTPQKSNKGKAGSKRTGAATRTSTTIGKSDTIGLWNRRGASMGLTERGRVLINRNRSHFATRPPAKSLASPPNPRADEDRDVGRWYDCGSLADLTG